MHIEHKRLLSEIKKRKVRTTPQTISDTDISAKRFLYQGSVPVRRQIAKEWLKKNKDISDKEFIKVLDSLYKGKSAEEKTMASLLLGYYTKGRRAVTTKQLDRWLNELVGWCEVDSLCQNIFSVDELLNHWKEWKTFIQKLSKDKNINKRRASIVFLTNVVRKSNDKRLKILAFEIIERLKHEKDILITKAISWLLRDLSTLYKKEVSAYLTQNTDTLPKVALRETWRKIKTGRK